MHDIHVQLPTQFNKVRSSDILICLTMKFAFLNEKQLSWTTVLLFCYTYLQSYSILGVVFLIKKVNIILKVFLKCYFLRYFF